MSGRLCCNKQQQDSKLLAQFVFNVSAFRFKTCMRAPLPDCRINNELIQFVPSCQDTRTQFVDVLDPPFRAGCSTCRLELTSRLTLELSRSTLHHAKIHESSSGILL